ncbi:glycosyltransferase [Flavobacteriaceae bacterium R38]|nr:glycosyltransferase [Flavobacteriaceae bacterium R38]
MRFLVITSAPTLKTENGYEAYGPYVYEMDIWFKYAKEITILCPTSYPTDFFIKPFENQSINIIKAPYLETKTITGVLSLIWKIPFILFIITREMIRADHIHLRCPGNISLLGAVIQVFFPKKKKTAKYAGNWDPKSKQPLSYRFQKWILSNTILTKKIKVLVYGEWPGQTKNILPFFTASYWKSEMEEVIQREYDKKLIFLFIGTLSKGKRPLLTLQIIHELLKRGINCKLDVYGDGEQKEILIDFIKKNNLHTAIELHGNKNKEVVKAQLQKAHFLILPSVSEGWPKVIAEAMFWGCMPISNSVSCIPWMLGEDERGVLIPSDLDEIVNTLISEVNDTTRLQNKSNAAVKWSRKYTLDLFENKIKQIM